MEPYRVVAEVMNKSGSALSMGGDSVAIGARNLLSSKLHALSKIESQKEK